MNCSELLYRLTYKQFFSRSSMGALLITLNTLGSNTAFAGDTPGLFDTSWLGFDTGFQFDNDSAWNPIKMTVADFNGDGFDDIATANVGNFISVTERISVIFNNGQVGTSDLLELFPNWG